MTVTGSVLKGPGADSDRHCTCFLPLIWGGKHLPLRVKLHGDDTVRRYLLSHAPHANINKNARLSLFYRRAATMKYPFLISIPHGGVEVPAEVAGRIALSEKEIRWYCDPATRTLFDFGSSVEATIDTPVSRMVIDLNRPPLPLPPKDPDGVIKVLTVDSRKVYLPGQLPDLPLIHRLMMKWYFPYHQRIDELIDRYPVRIAFDCHSMLPYGSAEQNDAGKPRPLICLGNYGDQNGRAKPGSITTCPADWIYPSRR